MSAAVPSPEWLIWQLVDSAFPTGAFAHSWGLEAAWQQGEVSTADDLRAFLRTSVHQAGHGVLPLVNAAHAEPGQLEWLDELADAFLLNEVANRASRVQGRTLMATLGRVWSSTALADLGVRVTRTHAHVAPLSGAAFRLVGLPLSTVQRMVLFGCARGVLSAAIRLGLAGSYEAQRLQLECAPWLDEVLQDCHDLDERDLTQTAPLQDLLQAGHDKLYSRLFQS